MTEEHNAEEEMRCTHCPITDDDDQREEDCLQCGQCDDCVERTRSWAEEMEGEPEPDGEKP